MTNTLRQPRVNVCTAARTASRPVSAVTAQQPEALDDLGQARLARAAGARHGFVRHAEEADAGGQGERGGDAERHRRVGDPEQDGGERRARRASRPSRSTRSATVALVSSSGVRHNEGISAACAGR